VIVAATAERRFGGDVVLNHDGGYMAEKSSSATCSKAPLAAEYQPTFVDLEEDIGGL
jgi:hypothetical protein